ncbi:MAG: ribosome silencing factor [Rhodospirillaceae bacterium]|nr:ribosome silencing factor [Rhodospirillaceae bacterium]
MSQPPATRNEHSNHKESPIPPVTAQPAQPETLAAIVVEMLDADKAEDVIVIDLRGRSLIADHLVIASGRSQRQIVAMAEHLQEKLKGEGLRVSAEGVAAGDWVLLDAGDIIVHLFRPEVRAFYALERMWGMQTPASDASSRAV